MNNDKVLRASKIGHPSCGIPSTARRKRQMKSPSASLNLGKFLNPSSSTGYATTAGKFAVILSMRATKEYRSVSPSTAVQSLLIRTA